MQLDALMREMGELRGAITALTDQIAATGRRRAPAAGRRDPGDSVPPGVAVQSPTPLSEDDRKTLGRLKRLSRR